MTIVWQGDALGIDRHGVHSWRRLRLLDTLRRESLAHLTLILLLHYLVKRRSRSFDFWRLQQCIHTGYSMPPQKIIVRPQNHWQSDTYLTLIRRQSTVSRSQTSTNWNINMGGPFWVTRLLNVLLASGDWRQRLGTCVRTGGGHFEHRLL